MDVVDSLCKCCTGEEQGRGDRSRKDLSMEKAAISGVNFCKIFIMRLLMPKYNLKLQENSLLSCVLIRYENCVWCSW